jgi:hypothetical protein
MTEDEWWIRDSVTGMLIIAVLFVIYGAVGIDDRIRGIR